MDAEALARDRRDRRGPLPLAVARPAVAQGRDLGQRPARSWTWRSTATATRCCVTVDPVGPTCHRGARSCFDAGRARPAERGHAGLRLARDALDDDRGARRGTAGRLLHDVACSTAASTPSAARSPRRRPRSCSPPRTTPWRRRLTTREALAGEAADLLYHALVLLAERDLAPAAVLARTLRASRHGRLTAAGRSGTGGRARPISRRRLPIADLEPLPGDGLRDGRRRVRTARRR